MDYIQFKKQQIRCRRIQSFNERWNRS